MIKLKVDDVYEGIIEFSNGGNASIKIENRNVFIFKKNTLNSLNLDTVKVKIILPTQLIAKTKIQKRDHSYFFLTTR